ncbi:MAG: DUF2085 domain-containing protein [Candidatus Thermoplasmatota archaeon]|nr:DUF2085 domain-containing protein [Candidatus Thermoplasmatota archaeon]
MGDRSALVHEPLHADMGEVMRNGLTDRTREQKVGRWVAGICGFYLVSCFLVPALMPTGSVPELSGRANMLDYANDDSWGNKNHAENSEIGHDQSAHGGNFSWMELNNPYFSIIYAFGDLNCHQKHERSWTVNENQMPICVRDVGIFLGLTLGAWWFSRRGFNRWTLRDTFLTLLPDKRIESLYVVDRRMKAMLLIGFVMCLPVILDGGIQAITSYESNNPLRLITGLPFGFIISWLLTSSLASRPAKFNGDASRVILPAGAHLMAPMAPIDIIGESE